MLFNSYIFVLLFLPVTTIGFYLIGGRGHHRIAISWLVAASLFFYGWANVAYLALILGSMLFNYAMGVGLENGKPGEKKGLLAIGVAVNLGLIAYYKYANFFIDNINLVSDSDFHLQKIILPIGISFFTFQQIMYLVDAYKYRTQEHNFLHYCLFVTFFPHLIAGPMLHHKEILPQFAKNTIYKLNYENLAVGITIFTLGLFKKVMLADNISIYATPVFAAADKGITLTFFEAWGGGLAYTLQLYFDFSGYSDMAIGLARLFGISLPLNFNSPYKAVNIIDFWRQWHITLARFLRDYLYIPLGGNRKGKIRQYANLMTTMLLGGLWHGAGWTFVFWGMLHGFYLTINHFWHAIRNTLGHDMSKSTYLGRGAARFITFLAVVAAWIFFRAESFNGAISMISSMSGMNGISLPVSFQTMFPSYNAWLSGHGFAFDGMFSNNLASAWLNGVGIIMVLLLIALYGPNTQEIMQNYQPALHFNTEEINSCCYRRLAWKPTKVFALLIAVMSIIALLNMSAPSEFLYFQF